MRGKHNRIWFDSPAQKQPHKFQKRPSGSFQLQAIFFVKSEKDPHSKGRALQMLFDRPRKGSSLLRFRREVVFHLPSSPKYKLLGLLLSGISRPSGVL